MSPLVAVEGRRGLRGVNPVGDRLDRQVPPLAGDWLDADFPATIEAAMRTSVAAAMALEEGLKSHAT